MNLAASPSTAYSPQTELTLMGFVSRTDTVTCNKYGSYLSENYGIVIMLFDIVMLSKYIFIIHRPHNTTTVR